jgi:hypothetical protein
MAAASLGCRYREAPLLAHLGIVVTIPLELLVAESVTAYVEGPSWWRSGTFKVVLPS